MSKAPKKTDSNLNQTATHEVFLVPAELFNALGQYLVQAPFNQVEQLIYGMRQCKPETRAVEAPAEVNVKGDKDA